MTPIWTRRIAYALLATGWLLAYAFTSESDLAFGLLALALVWALLGWRSLRTHPQRAAHAQCAMVPALLFGATIGIVVAPVFEEVARTLGVASDLSFDTWRGLRGLISGLCLGCTLIPPCHIILEGHRVLVRVLGLATLVALPCALGLAVTLQWRTVHWATVPLALGLVLVAAGLTEVCRLAVASLSGLRPSLTSTADVHPSRAYLPADQVRRIGVAMSGGGYRASLFGLGALMYIHDVCADRGEIDRRVVAVASVSGGSVTNGVIAHGVRIGREDRASFDRIAQRLIRHTTGAGSMFTTGHAFLYYVLLALSAILVLPLIWVMCSRMTPSIAWRIAVMPLGLLVVPYVALGVVFLSERVKARWMEGVLSFIGIAGFILSIGWLLEVFLSEPAWRRAVAWADGALLVIVGMVILWSLRGTLIQETFDILLRDRGASPLLADALPDTHHVFCSTEVQMGDSVYFAQDAIRVRGASMRRPGALPTAFAVRASAALPLAFPPVILGGFVRPISVAARRGEDDRVQPNHLVLVDGGVRDNLGMNWFDVAPPVDELIVVSAAANRHNARKILRLPGLSEVLALLAAINIPYNTRERWHRRTIAKQVLGTPWDAAASSSGAVVHIEDSPYDLAGKIIEKGRGAKSAGPWLDSTGEPDWAVDQMLSAETLWVAAGNATNILLDRAHAVVAHFNTIERVLPDPPPLPVEDVQFLIRTQADSHGEAAWWTRARRSATVGTKLSRSTAEEAANLVIHAYYLAMANLHVSSGWPLTRGLDRVRLQSLFGDVPLVPRLSPRLYQRFQHVSQRNLEREYPLVTLRALRVSIRRDGQYLLKHPVAAITLDRRGRAFMLGLWMAPSIEDVPSESAGDLTRREAELHRRQISFWSGIFADLQRRGVQTIRGCCRDSSPKTTLSPELFASCDVALRAAFPSTLVLVRPADIINSWRLDLTAGIDYTATIVPELKAVLRAVDAPAARGALDRVVSNYGNKYPLLVDLVARVWKESGTWFALSQETREVLIEVDDLVEEAARNLWKDAERRGHVIGDEIALSLLCEDWRIRAHGRRTVKRWSRVEAQFSTEAAVVSERLGRPAASAPHDRPQLS